MSHKVSVIVPCYFLDQSFVDMTKRCLESMGSVYEKVVVDDGSPITWNCAHDGCNEVIRKENGGYAAAVNDGLRIATGDILVICNNDIEFISPLWLEALTYPLTIGYSISSIRTSDVDGWTVEDRLEEDAKFGSIWAMRREVYETIGGLDESYGKGYFEDLDYYMRAKEAGFRIVKNHAGLVEHIGKATFKAVDPKDDYYIEARRKFRARYGATT